MEASMSGHDLAEVQEQAALASVTHQILRRGLDRGGRFVDRLAQLPENLGILVGRGDLILRPLGRWILLFARFWRRWFSPWHRP
jgi:hypothetical protein